MDPSVDQPWLRKSDRRLLAPPVAVLLGLATTSGTATLFVGWMKGWATSMAMLWGAVAAVTGVSLLLMISAIWLRHTVPARKLEYLKVRQAAVERLTEDWQPASPLAGEPHLQRLLQPKQLTHGSLVGQAVTVEHGLKPDTYVQMSIGSDRWRDPSGQSNLVEMRVTRFRSRTRAADGGEARRSAGSI